MEYLSAHQQHDIRIFHGLMEAVVTVDDMFPPDDEGVREPRRPKLPLPTLVGYVAVGGEL